MQTCLSQGGALAHFFFAWSSCILKNMRQIFQANRLDPEGVRPRNTDAAKMRRASPLFVGFVVLVAFFLWLNPSNLPDYEAYKLIYQYSLLGEDWEIFFIFVNVFFRQIGFSYSDFRGLILIFSSSALWLVLSRLQSGQLGKSASVRAANSFLMYFVIAVFLFEYSVIRIRAGFAIGIICCAILFLMSPRVMLGRILASVLLVLAFFAHRSTTLILIVFLGMPFVTAMWKGRPRSKRRWFVLVAVGAVASLLYIMNSSFELRGEHIFSPLNPVRFVMLSIVPLILYFFTKNESRITVAGSGALKEFPSYFVRFYAVLAIGLALMFVTGLTAQSGEALVRLYTLSSVPALLSLRLSGSALRAPISAYILVTNALFFLVTVLLPSQAG